MGIQSKINLTCGVLLFLAAPMTVTATDFTFNVPVNVQNQSINVTQGEVRCSAGKGKGSIGEGVQYFTLDNLGNFQDTLIVDFSATAGNDPATADSYECVLKLKNVQGFLIDESSIQGQGNYTVVGTF